MSYEPRVQNYTALTAMGQWMRATYPHVHRTLEVEVVGNYRCAVAGVAARSPPTTAPPTRSMLYFWRGSNPALKPYMLASRASPQRSDAEGRMH